MQKKKQGKTQCLLLLLLSCVDRKDAKPSVALEKGREKWSAPSYIEKSDAMPDGRELLRECQMRHPCSNRLIFLFSMPSWSGLCFCVSYLLGTASSKKRCYVKAFRVYNNPTKFASLIDLFELGRVIHLRYYWRYSNPRPNLTQILLVQLLELIQPQFSLQFFFCRQIGEIFGCENLVIILR